MRSSPRSPFGPRQLLTRWAWRQRWRMLAEIRDIYGQWPIVRRRKRHARYRRGREAVRPRHRGRR